MNIRKISHQSVPTIHRFYDTSPISPSGRYAALFELPSQTRMPRPGETGHVVVFSLVDGREVWRSPTSAWDTQLGAQVQWGHNDESLFFNRLDTETWRPFAVRINIFNNDEDTYPITVYMLDKDCRHILTPCLKRIGLLQPGYGVICPPNEIPRNVGFPSDDGIYIHNIDEDQCRLLVSFADIEHALPEQFAVVRETGGSVYGFHVKCNKSTNAIFFVVRWVDAAGKICGSCMVTMDSDGSNIAMPVDFRAWKEGHHPNWIPNSNRVIMNLRDVNDQGSFSTARRFAGKVVNKILRVARLADSHKFEQKKLYFCSFAQDGSDFRFMSRTHLGSGHPSVDRTGRYILTDSYHGDFFADDEGRVPIRLIDTADDSEKELTRVNARVAYPGDKRALRVDPHPVWCCDDSIIVFNGIDNGMRQVFLGTVDELVQEKGGNLDPESGGSERRR